MIFLRLLGLVLLTAVLGCGDPIDSESVTPPEVTPREAVKTAINQMLQSGAPGSEIGAIVTSIAKLKESDPALGEALEADSKELMSMISMNDDAKVKTKAQEMLKKLQRGGGT